MMVLVARDFVCIEGSHSNRLTSSAAMGPRWPWICTSFGLLFMVISHGTYVARLSILSSCMLDNHDGAWCT